MSYRVDKLVIDARTDTHTHTDAGNDNTRRPKLASGNNAISKLSWKFGESEWNSYWVIVLMSSYGTNYVPNEHEDVVQYDPYAIPFKIMPC